MADRLKLGRLLDDRPVKVAVELPASVWRDLQAYAAAMAADGAAAAEPAKLITPMLQRFMASDRVFAKVRRHPHSGMAPKE